MTLDTRPYSCVFSTVIDRILSKLSMVKHINAARHMYGDVAQSYTVL